MALGDTGSRLIGNTEFYGGMSTDEKIGIENSFYDAECLDVRKSPSQMSVLPMARNVSGQENINGLIVAMAQDKKGDIWAIDEHGKLYFIDQNNAIKQIPSKAKGSGHGLEYFALDDGLWMSDNKHSLFSYGNIVNPYGKPKEMTEFSTIEDTSEFIVNAIEIQQNERTIYYQSNPDIRRALGNQECAVPTTINETISNDITRERKTAALLLIATPSVESIGIKFTTKPATGNVRIEIHDENDRLVASSQPIDAGNIAVGNYTRFKVLPNPNVPESPSNQFTNFIPWSGNTIRGGTVFHVHVVASVDGFKVKTSDKDNMWVSLDLQVIGNTLIETYNGKHPMSMYDKLYIGNGRYVASKQSSPLTYLDDTILLQNVLRLDDGHEVCAFGSSDEYLVIGTEKESKDTTRGINEGKLYFWDRVTDSPNFSIDCKMGAPEAIYNFGNITYIIIAGALYAYTGGKELVKIRTFRGTDTTYSDRKAITKVNPNMMTVRHEMLLIGYPSETTAYSVRYGIRAFGSTDKNYPNSFTYNYKVPKFKYNSDDTTIRIGSVYNFGDTLFYSYEIKRQNETHEYLAVIDNKSPVSNEFEWRSLQYDAGSPAFQKMALRIGIYFDALPDGVTIRPMYRIDDGEWVEAPTMARAGDRYISCEINQRFHELQYGFKGTATGNKTPKIKQVSAEVRILTEEEKL